MRAGVVKWPEEWGWGSYLATVGKTEEPGYLTTDGILGQFGMKRENAEKPYAEFVLSGINRGALEWFEAAGIS